MCAALNPRFNTLARALKVIVGAFAKLFAAEVAVNVTGDAVAAVNVLPTYYLVQGF